MTTLYLWENDDVHHALAPACFSSFKFTRCDHSFLLRPWKKRCFLLLECFRCTLDMICGEKQTCIGQISSIFLLKGQQDYIITKSILKDIASVTLKWPQCPRQTQGIPKDKHYRNRCPPKRGSKNWEIRSNSNSNSYQLMHGYYLREDNLI